MERFWEAPWGEQPCFGVSPWECEPLEAQPFLNFPLLWPSIQAVPEGMNVTSLSVRPEGPDAWSSARLTLAGKGRRLRVKQYHFDWWRPTELAAALRRALGLYRAGERVVAWGRDYRGRATSCMALGRTTVELRIEQGTFVEIELRQLLANLSPVAPQLLPHLYTPSFPEISYHVRRGKGPRDIDELAAAEWFTDPDLAATQARVPLLLPEKMPPGWRFDGASIWHSPPPFQLQWLLRDERGLTVFYARARPTDDPQPLKLPAVYPLHEGWRARQTLVRRRRTTMAHQHPDLGGWSAAWAEEGYRYQVFVRAGALAGERAFRALVESLRIVAPASGGT